MHIVASRWILLTKSYDAQNHEYKIIKNAIHLWSWTQKLYVSTSKFLNKTMNEVY